MLNFDNMICIFVATMGHLLTACNPVLTAKSDKTKVESVKHETTSDFEMKFLGIGISMSMMLRAGRGLIQ